MAASAANHAAKDGKNKSSHASMLPLGDISEDWNPMVDDFTNPDFNHYKYGPAKYAPESKVQAPYPRQQKSGGMEAHQHTYKVYVNRLPFSIDESGLKRMCTKLSAPPLSVYKHPKIKLHPNATYGWAIVEYIKHSEAKTLIEKLDRTQPLMLDVRFSQTKEEREQAYRERRGFTDWPPETAEIIKDKPADNAPPVDQDSICTFASGVRRPGQMLSGIGRGYPLQPRSRFTSWPQRPGQGGVMEQEAAFVNLGDSCDPFNRNSEQDCFGHHAGGYNDDVTSVLSKTADQLHQDKAFNSDGVKRNFGGRGFSVPQSVPRGKARFGRGNAKFQQQKHRGFGHSEASSSEHSVESLAESASSMVLETAVSGPLGNTGKCEKCPRITALRCTNCATWLCSNACLSLAPEHPTGCPAMASSTVDQRWQNKFASRDKEWDSRSKDQTRPDGDGKSVLQPTYGDGKGLPKLPELVSDEGGFIRARRGPGQSFLLPTADSKLPPTSTTQAPRVTPTPPPVNAPPKSGISQAEKSQKDGPQKLLVKTSLIQAKPPSFIQKLSATAPQWVPTVGVESTVEEVKLAPKMAEAESSSREARADQQESERVKQSTSSAANIPSSVQSDSSITKAPSKPGIVKTQNHKPSFSKNKNTETKSEAAVESQPSAASSTAMPADWSSREGGRQEKDRKHKKKRKNPFPRVKEQATLESAVKHLPLMAIPTSDEPQPISVLISPRVEEKGLGSVPSTVNTSNLINVCIVTNSPKKVDIPEKTGNKEQKQAKKDVATGVEKPAAASKSSVPAQSDLQGDNLVKPKESSSAKSSGKVPVKGPVVDKEAVKSWIKPKETPPPTAPSAPVMAKTSASVPKVQTAEKSVEKQMAELTISSVKQEAPERSEREAASNRSNSGRSNMRWVSGSAPRPTYGNSGVRPAPRGGGHREYFERKPQYSRQNYYAPRNPDIAPRFRNFANNGGTTTVRPPPGGDFQPRHFSSSNVSTCSQFSVQQATETTQVEESFTGYEMEQQQQSQHLSLDIPPDYLVSPVYSPQAPAVQDRTAQESASPEQSEGTPAFSNTPVGSYLPPSSCLYFHPTAPTPAAYPPHTVPSQLQQPIYLQDVPYYLTPSPNSLYSDGTEMSPNYPPAPEEGTYANEPVPNTMFIIPSTYTVHQSSNLHQEYQAQQMRDIPPPNNQPSVSPQPLYYITYMQQQQQQPPPPPPPTTPQPQLQFIPHQQIPFHMMPPQGHVMAQQVPMQMLPIQSYQHPGNNFTTPNYNSMPQGMQVPYNLYQNQYSAGPDLMRNNINNGPPPSLPAHPYTYPSGQSALTTKK